MPVTLEWLTEGQNAIMYHVVDPWTWADFGEARTTMKDMVEAQPHEVHVIVNLSETNGMPRGFLDGMRRLSAGRPANQGRVVIVGGGYLIRRVAEIYRNTTNAQTLMVQDVDEALEALGLAEAH